MNSSSLSWASYYSSASDFHSSEEVGTACFGCLLLIFCCFQPNKEADKNALTAREVGFSPFDFRRRESISQIKIKYHISNNVQTVTVSKLLDLKNQFT
jgi:hypothetical protein